MGFCGFSHYNYFYPEMKKKQCYVELIPREDCEGNQTVQSSENMIKTLFQKQMFRSLAMQEVLFLKED